jgi:hypothetical protein
LKNYIKTATKIEYARNIRYNILKWQNSGQVISIVGGVFGQEKLKLYCFGSKRSKSDRDNWIPAKC